MCVKNVSRNDFSKITSQEKGFFIRSSFSRSNFEFFSKFLKNFTKVVLFFF